MSLNVEHADPPRPQQSEQLEKVVSHLLEEARMVLPGIQALFGFQFIAFFNQRFAEALSRPDQILHLVALILVAIAVVLVLTPAAYHRQVEPRSVSDKFVRLSGKCLTASMIPLMFGVCIDFYIVSHLVIGGGWLSSLAAGVLLCIYCTCWFIYPAIVRMRRNAC